ncbi:hypothetical protein SDRG_13285 [Saprolegnia diclina VS20]|uniref:TNFR-Cys domain-containing protein n=1 Tax=Saprolegnia diclina (strain VS20) TaxID=1156394 RepID=T0RA15_SAPDV|nr:hypothetical protein SDRG_13285 [Saprolegnia diclina VS20]EQC28948.1 hypothetical protein SDRG_13285 [Saprolegnia diclina VS20]|eukprot:XP_008617587.1 hypothetical protein SDRG_13285 [Saprolegnia diclina VS20]
MRSPRRRSGASLHVVVLGIMSLAASATAACYDSGRCYLYEGVPIGVAACDLASTQCPPCVQKYLGNLWCSRTYPAVQCLPGFEYCPVAPKPNTPSPTSPTSPQPTSPSTQPPIPPSPSPTTTTSAPTKGPTPPPATPAPTPPPTTPPPATPSPTPTPTPSPTPEPTTTPPPATTTPAPTPNATRPNMTETVDVRDPSLAGTEVARTEPVTRPPAVMTDKTDNASSRTESATLPGTSVHSASENGSSPISITAIAAGVGACTVFIFVVIVVRFRRRQDWETRSVLSPSKVLFSIRGTLPGTFMRGETPTLDARSSPFHSVTPVMELSSRQLPILQHQP